MKNRAKTKRRTARVFTSPGHYRKAKGGVYRSDGTPVQMPVYIPPDIEGDIEIDPPADINGYVPDPEPLFDDETDLGVMPSLEWRYDQDADDEVLGEIDDEPDSAAAAVDEDAEDAIEKAIEAMDDSEASESEQTGMPDEMDDYVPEPEEEPVAAEGSEEPAADGPSELSSPSADDLPETSQTMNAEPDSADEGAKAVPTEKPFNGNLGEEAAIPVVARPVIREIPPVSPSATKVRWK